MSPVESFWTNHSGPHELVWEDHCEKSLDKGGYLAMMNVRGYPLFGYIIPNAEFPGKGTFFIILKPATFSYENSFALSDEAVGLITRLNIGLDENCTFDLLGASDNKVSGEFEVKSYADTTTLEGGVKITNLDLNHRPKPEINVSNAKSIRGFVTDLEEQTDLKIEMLTISELREFANQPKGVFYQ